MDVAEAAARMVAELASGAVVDLGCGGGHLCRSLADAGFRTAGFDVSPAMVADARRLVPEGRFWVDDAKTAEVPDCDVVTATGEVLAYGSDAATFRRVLGRIHAALPPDGLLLFDLPAPGRASTPTHAMRSGKGWKIEAWTHEEGDGLVRRLRATVGEETSTETHHLALFAPDDVSKWLEQAGFRAERLGGYDDHGFIPGWDGYLARA